VELSEGTVAHQLLYQFAGRFRRKPGRTLVVGSRLYDGSIDRRALYEDAFGVDMLDGAGVDLQHDMEDPLPEAIGRFDHIDLCSVLEHVRRPWLLAANVEAAMAPDATLLVSVPFVWRLHSYPSDYWRISPEGLDALFPGIQWLGKKFVVGSRLRKRTPSLNWGGERWLARSETVAFGVKCSTSSSPL